MLILTLVMLTASIKSQGQEIETCYSLKQVKRINEYRKDCETCKLDLADTRLALDECTVAPSKENFETSMITGFAGIVTGFLIGLIVIRR